MQNPTNNDTSAKLTAPQTTETEKLRHRARLTENILPVNLGAIRSYYLLNK